MMECVEDQGGLKSLSQLEIVHIGDLCTCLHSPAIRTHTRHLDVGWSDVDPHWPIARFRQERGGPTRPTSNVQDCRTSRNGESLESVGDRRPFDPVVNGPRLPERASEMLRTTFLEG